VTFHISADGIVSVKAKDLETALEQSITVTATSGLTEDEIRRMVEDNRDYMMEVRSSQEFEKNRQQAERLLEEIEHLFPRVSEIISGSEFGQDAVKKARTVIDKAHLAIGQKDIPGIVESAEALTRTLNMFKGVVSKAKAP
jgi:molecular chaperone DnaK